MLLRMTWVWAALAALALILYIILWGISRSAGWIALTLLVLFAILAVWSSFKRR